MVQKKKKSTKSRKTTKKVKRQFMRAIGNNLMLLLKWLVVSFIKIMHKNPIASLGFCLFLGFLSFFIYHASFNQKMIARSFFFQSTSNKPKDATAKLTIEHLLKIDGDLPADVNTHQTIGDNQHSPSPREHPPVALETQTSLANNAPFLNIFPQLKPKPLTNKIPNSILSKEKAQIMRVQAALSSFGNNDLIINGIADNKTKAAILAFQKTFALKETGTVDRELLIKMREVGLLENDINGLY